MRKPRYTDSQILAILKQNKNGLSVSDLCREHSISSEQFYEWGAKFGGMNASMMKRLKELEDDNRRLKIMHAELEEFAYRASHDLRSPLASSKGLLTITEEAILKNNTSLALESLHHANNALSDLDILISDTLSLTLTKNLEEENQLLIIEDIVEQVLTRLNHMENFQRLHIEKSISFSKPLLTKKSRFMLIVENLLSNAIKYQDIEKQHSYIKIKAYQKSNSFLFEVHDNGLGIPEKQKDNLFKMFKRFHPKVSFGTGLGLYMIKKSADIIGGDIDYKDSREGSIFTLKIDLENETVGTKKDRVTSL